MTPETILTFWFEETGPERWFASSAAFDAEIRRRFGPFCGSFRQTPSVTGHDWLGEARPALALVIALDQFPRNIWRGSNAAFTLDPLGLEAARAMLEAGQDLELTDQQRPFAYMPFMHSEALADQELCVSLCETRLPAGNSTLRHARAHRDVIARFGRFPYRNAALGRTDTPDEAAWLAAGGYRPGD
ncbi:DUF924 domain-containing protein [Alkalicaulis satelles]|uniref:DUF924 domain-containing protein n=1 Tax=Alkalicaulis satelles TaxID=2609175 RepID=A0A5M6ZJ47_9PROT|nr:DUF924 family protein [Alkalicaulis satelles]KAA5802251.1 DUF924 domain-containing protein [Alkalicaulis satelles]